MLAWIHRNLPTVLAAMLSLLLHVAVLFPAMEVLGLGPHRKGGERASLGKAFPGLDGKSPELERDKLESDRAREKRLERERLMQRKLNVRRMQRELDPPRRKEVDPAVKDEPKPTDPELRREDEEKVELGIDESNAVTMNWIGYAEYEKHLAALSEVEQAALRLEVASGSGGMGSPTLPPAPPGPMVAMSPDPSTLPLPAAEGGPELPTETDLVTIGSTHPSSPPSATARTEPDASAGSSTELARPVQPPERELARPMPEPSPETSPETSPATTPEPIADPATPLAPADLPSPMKPGSDANAPAQPNLVQRPTTDDPFDPVLDPALDPAMTSAPKPAPKPEDPTRTDPTSDAVTRDPVEADPSKVEPSKRLDPAESGAAENLPPRENADRTIDSPKPPIEAPTSEREPEQSAELSRIPVGEGSARNPSEQPPSAAQGGGVKGPEVVNGQSNTAVRPSPAGTPGDARTGQGALSNRESDPTSILDVPAEFWQLGRPLARKGIELRTFKPTFTTQQIVDGPAFNPIVELVIGRDGVPQHVTVVRSSGNIGINEALRAACFKWRASGKQIEQLKPGQTKSIRMRIIMRQD